jgi:hypothetical protein
LYEQQLRAVVERLEWDLAGGLIMRLTAAGVLNVD